MRQLVIDTATEALSVALFEGELCLAQSHEILGRGHAEQLLPRISALPGGGRADRILVDIGPGSFTGVRVGIAAARALGFAWHVPVESYSALALIAHMAQVSHTASSPITVVITGGHGELFWQQFTIDTLAPLSEPASTPISQLGEILDVPIAYGTGAPALMAARGHGEACLIHPDASRITRLPSNHIHPDAHPLYGRGADAIPLQERRDHQ